MRHHRIRRPTAGEASQRILRVHFPEKAKLTQMIAGSADDAAKQLVARLKDEARVL